MTDIDRDTLRQALEAVTFLLTAPKAEFEDKQKRLDAICALGQAVGILRGEIPGYLWQHKKGRGGHEDNGPA